MKLCSLSSGSSGNCIYVGSENSGMLVDCGVSGKHRSLHKYHKGYFGNP